MYADNYRHLLAQGTKSDCNIADKMCGNLTNAYKANITTRDAWMLVNNTCNVSVVDQLRNLKSAATACNGSINYWSGNFIWLDVTHTGHWTSNHYTN